jgi:hypothetical protein
MRQEGQRSAEAIVCRLIDEAAAGPQEAVKLPARRVKDPGRTPALGAAHDRRVAVARLYTRNFVGNEIERVIPCYGHEALAPTARSATGTAPALAHHRSGNAGRRMHARRDRLDQDRRVGVVLERPHPNNTPVLDLGKEGTPVGVVANPMCGHEGRALFFGGKVIPNLTAFQALPEGRRKAAGAPNQRRPAEPR